MQVFRVLIIASVLVGIAFALRSAWLELEKSEINWSEVRPIWLLLSGMAYAIGMLVPPCLIEIYVIVPELSASLVPPYNPLGSEEGIPSI